TRNGDGCLDLGAPPAPGARVSGTEGRRSRDPHRATGVRTPQARRPRFRTGGDAQSPEPIARSEAEGERPREADRDPQGIERARQTGSVGRGAPPDPGFLQRDSTRSKSTRLNSSHVSISYAVFC